MDHKTLFKRAQRVIPGGVNSPVRAFNGVGGTPVFVESGKRQKIVTADGRTLTDYCCSWGAMILGHARAEVVAHYGFYRKCLHAARPVVAPYGFQRRRP